MPDSTENWGRPAEKNPSLYYTLILTAGILGTSQTCLYFIQPGGASSMGAGSRTTTWKQHEKENPISNHALGRLKLHHHASCLFQILSQSRYFKVTFYTHAFSCIFKLLRFPESNVPNLLWNSIWRYSFLNDKILETCWELLSSLRKDQGLTNYFFCDVHKPLSSVKTYQTTSGILVSKKKVTKSHAAFLYLSTSESFASFLNQGTLETVKFLHKMFSK